MPTTMLLNAPTTVITDYERWKFRRCIETIDKNQCPDSCDGCDFDVELSKHVLIASEDVR